MKTIPSALQTHLASRQLRLAWCWAVTRTDGVSIRGTEHDADLVVPSGAYAGTYLSRSGIAASGLRSSSDLAVDNLEVGGAFRPSIVLSVSARDIEARLYNRARLAIFQVRWDSLADGIMNLHRGFVGQFTRDSDGRWSSEARGLTQLLSQTLGQTYSERCNVRHFGDARCGFDVSTLESPATVSVATSRRVFTVTFDAPNTVPPAWLPVPGGEITWTSGDNDGLTREVKSLVIAGSTVVVTLYEELPDDVTVGDTLTIIPGCDRTATTCKTVYENLDNFRGYGLFIPGALALMRGPSPSTCQVNTPPTTPVNTPGTGGSGGGTTPPPTDPPTPPTGPSTPPSPPPTPIVGADIKWHPGHYVSGNLMNTGQLGYTTAWLDDAASVAAVQGWHQRITWAVLEPSPGVYDFSRVVTLLNACESRGLRLILAFIAQTFGGTGGSSAIPSWLASSAYGTGGGIFNKPSGGATVKYWEPAVMAKFIDLAEALATRFDDELYFEGFCSQETAPGFPESQAPAGYSRSTYIQNLKDWSTAMASAFVHTNVCMWANFAPGGTATIASLLAHNYSHRVGAGGPDILPNNPTDGQRYFAGAGGTDYRGTLPMINEIQSPELGGQFGYYTPTQLAQAAYNNGATHLAWLYKTYEMAPASTPDLYWNTGSPSIKSYLSGSPLTLRTACPTTYGGNCVS